MIQFNDHPISKVLHLPIIFIIRAYRWVSPLKQLILGPYARCRFYPTCSEYSLECFRYLPFFQAVSKSVSRICKCNPIHPGGYDPVFPDEEKSPQPIELK